MPSGHEEKRGIPTGKFNAYGQEQWAVSKETSEMSSPQRGRDSEQISFSRYHSRSLSPGTVKDHKQQEEELCKALVDSSDKDERDDAVMQTMPYRNQKKLLKISEGKMTDLETKIRKSKSDIMQVNTMIMKENQLQKDLKKQLKDLKEFVGSIVNINKEKVADVMSLIEKVRESKLEKSAVLEKSASEIERMRSQLAATERTLNQYTRFEDILFKLSPDDWQEIQKTEALKVQVPSERGVETTESSLGQTTPSATASGGARSSLESYSILDSHRSEHKREPVLYFSEPEELLEVMSSVTEQILSLIRNCRRVDELHMEQANAIEMKRKSIEESEAKAKLQLSRLKDRLNQVKEGTVRLKQKVQLHDSLKTTDKDIMLNALDKTVSEVYHCCVNKGWTTLGTLEKLTRIENRMSTVVEQVENMPKAVVEKLTQVKMQEKRSRLQEEKRQLEKKKQELKMKKYTQRAVGETKKMSRRRLMPRSYVGAIKKVVPEEDDISDEDDAPDSLLSDTEDF